MITAAGAEKLRDALAALGLKSGGTSQQRADRLFQTKGVPLASIPKKLFAKGAAPPVRVSYCVFPTLKGLCFLTLLTVMSLAHA